jgi:type III secretion protein V
MAYPNSAKPSVEIELTAPACTSLGGRGIAEMLGEVTRYVEGMASDLLLPMPEIAIRDITGHQIEVAVFVNGSRCRASSLHSRNAPLEQSSRAISSSITRILHANRELLIDESVAHGIRLSRSTMRPELYLPGLSRTAFHHYLRRLARNGFRLDKGDSLAATELPAIALSTAEACFDEATAQISGLGCLLWRSSRAGMMQRTIDKESIEHRLKQVPEKLFYELGVRFPRIDLRDDCSLDEDEFRIQINDLRLPPMQGLKHDEMLVNDTMERLKALDIDGRPAHNPETGTSATIITIGVDSANALTGGRATTWDQTGYTVLACTGELRRHAAAYITMESIQHELDVLNPWYGDVIASAKKRFGLPMIAQTLRSLVEEGFGIRHLNGVLEAMLAVKSTIDVDFGRYIVFHPYTTVLCPAVFGKRLEDVGPEGYAECVRSQFQEQITNKHAPGESVLVVYLLDPTIESRISRSVEEPLTDQERNDLVDAVESEIQATSSVQIPVILTTLEARKRLRRLIELELPDVAVLAYQELSPNFRIQPVARISL